MIAKMGASESSMLAVEEKAACFKRGPELTTELYRSELKSASPVLSKELFNAFPLNIALVLLPDCLVPLQAAH